MSSPVTTLDRPYSDPAAAAVGWEETTRILQDADLFWICTVRADGRPHVTPVVAVWVDGTVSFTTGAEEQKFLNLRSNPQVVLITGCNSWDRGIDVVIEGKAAQVTDDAELSKLAAAFAAKWDGRWQFAVGGGGFRDPGSGDGPCQAQVFSVAPAKVFAHAKGDPFGATRHKF
jgi:uncharacterized pyridoxamine 5'-phosphate oxidase family protein